MGQEVEAREFTRGDRRRYRDKVGQNLAALRRMLAESTFDEERTQAGLEIELNLVDDQLRPAMQNRDVLSAIDDPQFQTELGRFNVEINLAPQTLNSSGLTSFETSVRKALDEANRRASEVGCRLVIIGILPTLSEEYVHPDSLSEDPRYSLLDEQILNSRGENLIIDIEGKTEHLHLESDSIMPEAACTSTQVHLQVNPDEFAPFWNAAQAIAGLQIAVGANSPYLFGHRLYDETRIPLFEQSTDTRSEDLKTQGVRPRVWFGERWIGSIFDLFEENARYYSALLPVVSDEDPMAMLDAGETPRLSEMMMHNGTVYRWNRPIYDVAGGEPHLRVENRVLPAGPTIADTMANTAFFAGLVRGLASQPRPVWRDMSFLAAEENFNNCTRDGITAQVYWPGTGLVPASELVLRKLLPIAATGLTEQGVDEGEISRLLGIIEQRCVHGINGATWQVDHVESREKAGDSRAEALRGMLGEYLEHMHTNEPIHTWGVTDGHRGRIR